MDLSGWTILLDAVGTVIWPDPEPAKVYQQVAANYGNRLPLELIRQRFVAARKRFSIPDPAAEGALVSSDAIEKQLWRELVQEVLAGTNPIDAAFDDLWRHYSQPESWSVYPDVVDCLEVLERHNAVIVIASNFDTRLKQVAEALSLSRRVTDIFCSAEVGYRKPDPNFYHEISRSMVSLSRENAVMVGDDFEKDVLAPKRLGWHSIWLDRRSTPGRPDGDQQEKFPFDAVSRITSLDQLFDAVTRLACGETQ